MPETIPTSDSMEDIDLDFTVPKDVVEFYKNSAERGVNIATAKKAAQEAVAAIAAGQQIDMEEVIYQIKNLQGLQRDATIVERDTDNDISKTLASLINSRSQNLH